MGIGTSLGAYFDDSLQHHAGNEFDIYKPNTGTARDNNEWSPNEVMPTTPEPVDPEEYNTALTPDQEVKFQDWKGKNAPNDSGHDYDLRGAFLNNIKPDEKTGHWPDTFKKPNHPTFSDQSMYAGERPDLAGRWQDDVYIPPLPITPIANITNTPGEIMSGVEGVRMFPQGYGARGGPTAQMRRGANDNKNLDLGTGGMSEKDIDASWSRFRRGNDIIEQRGRLMDKLRDSGLNDIENQKLKNLNKEHEQHFNGYSLD